MANRPDDVHTSEFLNTITAFGLPKPVFSHGQLYVTIVTSRSGLKILMSDENGASMDSTSNVAYKEIFCNLPT